jgi:hypothetical protein
MFLSYLDQVKKLSFLVQMIENSNLNLCESCIIITFVC